MLMSRAFRHVVLLVSGTIAVYFLIPVLLLRFGLDRWLFPVVTGGITHEDKTIDVPLAAGRTIRVRQYGESILTHCVIFFPGRGGGVSTYEETLFPSIQKLGITLYALSYPGQDGAKGRSHSATLLQDVDTALATVRAETSCDPAGSVFVGRSLGATVAVHAAQSIRPKGLLLDGVTPTLTVAVKAEMRQHIATRPWTLLPLRSLLRNDFELTPLLQSLSPIPIVIFQGTKDDVTPFSEIQGAVAGHDNVQLDPVPGGTHGHLYRLVMPEYRKALRRLTESLE
jgi:alpha-beta hydrolase superfamily lysophospholipase